MLGLIWGYTLRITESNYQQKVPKTKKEAIETRISLVATNFTQSNDSLKFLVGDQVP